jgi:hypothetical protein
LRWTWKGAIPLVAIAVILGMRSDRGRIPAECNGRHGRGAISDDGECIRITLDPPAKKSLLKCVVRGVGGQEPLSLSVGEGGSFQFWIAPGSPVRMVGGRRRNGAVFQGVDNGNVALDLKSYSDGSSDVTVIDSTIAKRSSPPMLLARLKVTKEGRVIPEELPPSPPLE